MQKQPTNRYVTTSKKRLSDRDLWNLAERVLTHKQLEALQLRHRDDLTIPTIATVLGITPRAVADRLATAHRTIARHLRKETA